MSIPFTKMHGLGNDFIVLNEWDDRVARTPLRPQDAIRWCDRRFGVGADQILVVGPPVPSQPASGRSPDARMDIWNSDGSRAEMCGNGIRAVALYLHDHAPADLRGRSSYWIQTGAGVLEVTLQERLVRVNMGPPRRLADRPEDLRIESETLSFWEVDMGNPHAVFFLKPQDSLQGLDLERLGPQIEHHSRFPKRTNVEFVQLKAPDELDVRVWERGAGVTLACGTGACASAVAALHSRLVAGVNERSGVGSVRVNLPGGTLELAWDGKKTSPVWMTGPAVEVFQGFY